MKKAKLLSCAALTLAMVMGTTSCGGAPQVAGGASSTPASTPASAPASTASSTPAATNPKIAEHTIEAIKKKGVISFATESQYAPFCFKNDKGEIIGLEAQLMQAIADDLGVKLEIQDMSFDNVIPSVQNGAVDVGIAGLTSTNERKEAVNMSDVYSDGGQSIVVLTKDLEKYATKESLKGLTLGAQKASLQQQLGEEQFGECKLQLLPKVPQCVEELKAGSVVAVLMDNDSAKQYEKANPGIVSVSKIPVEISEDMVGSSMAFMKGNDELTSYMNGLIKKLWDNGDLKKWFTEATEQASKLGLNG